MKTAVEKKPKSTIELTVTIPKAKVKETYDEIFKEVAKNADIKGFRKGQAPEDVVKQNTDTSAVQSEVINKLLQTSYPQALKENHIQPVSNPKVEIKEFDIEKDLEFTATVAVQPEIKIGDYKAELKKIQEKRSEELKELNAEKLKAGEKLGMDHAHLTADDVIDAILNVTEVEMSDVLVDEETDRMMARLVNQAQTVGLSLDQYLISQNKSAEELRSEYAVAAERTLKAEFALAELVKLENIEVSDAEVEGMINAAPDPQTKEQLSDPAQKWYIKSIISKNKLISKLIEEVEGPHDHDHGAEDKSKDEEKSNKEEKVEKEGKDEK